MTQFGPILIVATTLVGAALVALVAHVHDRPDRRLRRGLRIVLGDARSGTVLAAGHGRAIGLDPATNTLAVLWDTGAWGLLYDLKQLRYAEVRADDQLLGSAWRGRSQKLFDFADTARNSVSLRLVFEDEARPEFALDLWRHEDTGRRGAPGAREAMAEAAGWLGRMEGLLNRPEHSWWEPASKERPAPAAPKANGARLRDASTGKARGPEIASADDPSSKTQPDGYSEARTQR